MFRNLCAALLLAGGLVLAACGGDENDDDASSGDQFATTPQPTQPAQPTATSAPVSPTPIDPATIDCGDPAPAPQGVTVKTYDAPPPFTIDPDKTYVATIQMDIGDITLELYPKDAPCHVNSFVFLAREGFYDGVTFHRVIPGFVAQAGDPTGTGTGGPGYTIKDEVNSRKFVDGTLGMAKTSAPNSAGSQWFICYAPQPNLDGGYTVFGQLTGGRDVLDQIAPRDPRAASAPGTAINAITIEER